ncbi:hypothetical protein AM493_06340 [Flavobacterium akiainvivens]|uniref:Uncharacterized protein n=1 Tax=Flavobacterium akiainvivens TaxID=1202724 RepID=A0A0M9VHL2_9FLAO|nr:hypothetical protein [Flavobacterium akiainvivens]KOS05696.1 hypothetical protein AM493_06340 [Flavobacterium akiainvivens]SFQ36847.1 hypothetical protein SAMN05444144_103306 [Flavobacterium akiainvivens]
MGLEIFKTNVTTQQQADYLLLLLRQRISDGIIYFYPQGTVHTCHIQTNRDITDIACAFFNKEGFDCQKL